MNKKWFHLWLVVTSILFLGNCDLFKSSGKNESTKESVVNDSSPAPSAVITEDVLLTINGKPVITVSQYNEYLDTVMNAQPQLKQLMAFMPDVPYEIFQQMAKEYIVLNWITSQGIDKTAEYQKDKKMSTDFLERQLALKHFQEKYPKVVNLNVSDDEVRKTYEEQKKTIPQLTISRGGVNAKGVMFNTQAEAQDFLNKVKEPGVKFEDAAKEKQFTVKDFVSVNEYSFDVDPQIKEKLTAAKKVSTYEVIKSKDNKYWVINITGKEEAKYVPLEEVKDAFKQQLLVQKLFGEELDKLQKQMNIVENKVYFEKMRQDKKADLDSAIQDETAVSPQVPSKPSAAPKKAKAVEKKNEKGAKPAMPTPPVQGA